MEMAQNKDHSVAVPVTRWAPRLVWRSFAVCPAVNLYQQLSRRHRA